MEFIDEGYSGSTLVRPALERLRDVVAAGTIDRLYVHSPDRLARKYAYQVLLVDEFRRSGVEVIFLNRELGQTPEMICCWWQGLPGCRVVSMSRMPWSQTPRKRALPCLCGRAHVDFRGLELVVLPGLGITGAQSLQPFGLRSACLLTYA